MKIRAVRIADVGPFIGGVAIEGFSGHLDVLTGPNETGKSTLLAALALLIGEKHTSTARSIASLRSDRGGAPLVEADLEIDGGLWRLRKRFLVQRSAELTELGSGASWRGAEAEERLAGLMGAREAVRGFVWVPQLGSFDLPDQRADRSVATLTTELSHLIEQQAADAAGAGLPRRLAAEIDKRLGEFVTLAHGKARAGGPLDQARRRRSEIEGRLENARTKAQQAAARLQRLGQLREEQRAADAQEARSLAIARLEGARRAVSNAEQARERLRTAAEKVAGRQLAADRVRSDLATLDRRIAELAQVQSVLSDVVAGLAASRREREQHEARAAVLRPELEAASGELAELRRLVALVHAQELQRSAQAELEQLDRRLADAHAISGEITEAEQALAGDPIRVAHVEQAKRISARVSLLEARIAQSAPVVTFSREPSATARVEIDGAPFEEGGRLAIERSSRIVVEGVGVLTIELPAVAGAADADTRDACRAELDALLASLSVADVAQAQVRLTQRFDRERALELARARLATLAPRGLAALREERTAALTPSAGGQLQDLPDRASLEQRIEAAAARLDERREGLARVAAAARDAAEQIARLEEQEASARQREREILAELPPVEAREGRRRALTEAVTASGDALGEAVREQAAWADVALEGQAFEKLVAGVRAAEAELAAHDQSAAVRDREVSTLEGALRRDGEEGVGAEIAGLEEELAAADERVCDLEAEVRALELLRARVAALGTRHREEVLRPIAERLQPLLDALLPGARLSLEGPLLVTRLERGERTDTMARLSGGTREQVATLVRLAYAGLMADRGQELPLVLDDALVFSDDERLARMVGILAQASQRHQVILLSCRERALEQVLVDNAACRLELVPWADADGASHTIGMRKGRSAGPAPDLA